MNGEYNLEYQKIEQELREVDEKMQIVQQQISELNGFLSSLENLNNVEECRFLASLGKGVYLKSEIKEDKLFVDVGSGILIRKSIGEAKKIAEEQIKKLNEMKLQLSHHGESISEKARSLVRKFEKK